MSQNKLDTIIATSKDLSTINESLGVLRDKLDKVIELLTPKEIIINSTVSVTSSNEQTTNINKAFMNLAQKLNSENRVALNNRIDKRPLVIERNETGKRLREGRLHDDGRVEWQRVYS